MKLFGGVYENKRVLITGHTGFKGSWLAIWLTKLGANVYGYSLEPTTTPNHYGLLEPIPQTIGDIRDGLKLREIFDFFQPQIVFHLAAQPLVRESYLMPDETFEVNVMGTLRVLEAARSIKSVKAIVNVTSDKCYENREWVWPYRESDPMGGYDPYSASKGCAELLTQSYRKSFFSDNGSALLASARAGNVIGGGDWAKDRLVPDLVRCAAAKSSLSIRSPYAVRPWQHVLDPLSGYLSLGQKLLSGENEFAQGWNFGPANVDSRTVKQVAEAASKIWENVKFVCEEQRTHNLHEASMLRLDCSLAYTKLSWEPTWDFEVSIAKTIEWYRLFYEEGRVLSGIHLEQFIDDAVRKGVSWVK